MENEKYSSQLDFIGLLKIVLKWKKQLMVTAVIAAVAGFVITRPFIMKPRFKSATVVFPSNIAPYATESATETMLQFLQSEEVRKLFIEKLNLYGHYNIDPKSPLAYTYLSQRLSENMSISRTQYESIEIDCWDEDPKFAAAMCDTLIAANNIAISNLHRQKFNEVITLFEQKLALRKAEMDSAEIALQNIKLNYGIINFESQVKAISKVMYKNGGAQSAFVKDQFKNLQEHGGQEFALTEHLFRLRGFYNDTKKDYQQAISDANKKLTYTTVVSKAQVAEKKDTPKGTLIIMGLTASALLFALITILIIESYRKHTLKNSNA
ncbi:MAG: hypothetical protein JNK61_11400 [Bacteroidia bacterium]|nr:hypothetical protein [Bacteroidia bacterium]HQU99876.1 Wzz/FepE/Etk N-terminal domain-containing protein [Bacteroidia bacterium]